MTATEKALQDRLRADPRLQQAVQTQRQGRIDAEALRQLGYDVPAGYHYVFGGRAGNGSLLDNKQSWFEKGYPAMAIAATAGGIALAPAWAATSAAGTTTGATTGATVATTAAGGLGRTAIKYGLEYGLPTAVNYLGARAQANAQRDSDKTMADYYQKALDAEKEEQQYRRGFDEEERGYSRGVSEENQRYGRYSDSYGRESSEEDRAYGRAGDTYGRASDEERLAYDRSQAIRDKNYGYQQYGNFVETLEPFRASGSGAISRMSGLMGGPRPADTGSYLNLANTARQAVQAVPSVPDRPTWNYEGTRPTWNYAGAGQTAGAAANAPVSTTQPVGGSPQLVRVQAPDGEIRELPREQADIAVTRGARLV